MLAHKETSHKVHRPTRSANARHILVWSTANDVSILCMRFERLIHSACADFAPRKLLFVLRPLLHHPVCSLVKTSHMRQTQKIKHAWWGLDCDLRPNGKKTKPKFQLGLFPWKARIKSGVYISLSALEMSCLDSWPKERAIFHAYCFCWRKALFCLKAW